MICDCDLIQFFISGYFLKLDCGKLKMIVVLYVIRTCLMREALCPQSVILLNMLCIRLTSFSHVYLRRLLVVLPQFLY